jgi:hypothetical protein
MINMKIRHLWPFAFGIIIIVSMNSCTKTNTVVQTKTVDSTVVDTVGRGWVRFVSMFPQASQINIYEGNDTIGLPFAVAQNSCPSSYIQVSPNLPTIFRAYIPSLGGFQLLPIPEGLGPTMNTYALFLSVSGGDSTFYPKSSIDSEQFTPPPADSCYVRLINGIPDAPGPFFVDLDDTALGHSVFYSNSQPQSIPNFSFSYYALVPAGQHTIYLRLDEPNNPQTGISFSTSYLFEGGGYYTILATGSINGGGISVNQE